MACLYCDAAEATALTALGGTAAVPVFWGQGGGAKELGPREKVWNHGENIKILGRDGWKMGAGVT